MIPMFYMLGSIGCIHIPLTVQLFNSFHSRVCVVVKLTRDFFVHCELMVN